MTSEPLISQWTRTLMRFPIVPEGTKRAASFPMIFAISVSNRNAVGSFFNTSSSTSALAIAALIASVGFVTVSERRSTVLDTILLNETKGNKKNQFRQKGFLSFYRLFKKPISWNDMQKLEIKIKTPKEIKILRRRKNRGRILTVLEQQRNDEEFTYIQIPREIMSKGFVKESKGSKPHERSWRDMIKSSDDSKKLTCPNKNYSVCISLLQLFFPFFCIVFTFSLSLFTCIITNLNKI